MKTIKIKLKKGGYSVHVGVSLADLGKNLKLHKPSNVLVVTSSRIYQYHSRALIKGLKQAHLDPVFTMVPEGEQHKTIEQANLLYKSCVRAELDRNSMIIGFGGGVIGDLAGFTAATYLRGIPLIHVPTNLLSMVDSSIGGKTGVDLPEGKNLVGSFYQPQMVWMDVSTLRTLPAEHWNNGMAEVIKYGIIADKNFFNFLEQALHVTGNTSFINKLLSKTHNAYQFGLSEDQVEKIITTCAEIKARVVTIDELERKGKREILNFGHTFGHALETITKYEGYLHGEAVAVGMVIAARVAEELGMFKSIDQVKRLLTAAHLPVDLKKRIDIDAMMAVMRKDKKVKKGKIRFVLPLKIGRVEICENVPEKLVRSVLKEFS
ncbi:MAG: 3-dehydroquinate synthase [bacterium]